MILPFIITLVAAFVVGLIQGDILAGIWSSAWYVEYEEAPR